MLALALWKWLLLIVFAAVFLMVAALRSFRRKVRREFVEHLRRKYPQVQIVRETGSSLLIQLPESGKAQITAFLGNLYSQVSALKPDTPEGRAAIYQTKLNALEENIRRGSGPLNLESEGPHIRPRLMNEADLQSMHKQFGKELPHSPLAGTGLVVVYVLDGQESVMYLTQDHVKELGLDPHALHDRAIENLRATFSEKMVRGAVDGKQMNMIKLGDTYDAARLLLVPACLKEGEAVGAVVPDRDTLAVFPVPANDDWAGLEKLAKTPSSQPVLLTRPLKVTAQGFELR